MKYAILPVLAVAGLVHAAPFSGQGIPSATEGVLHLDLDASGQSELVKTIREIGEAIAADNSAEAKSNMMEKLKKELGVDDKSIGDMTVALLQPGKPGADPVGVFRIRGHFNRAKFEALSKNHPELIPHKSGKYVWYSTAGLAKVFGDKAAVSKSGSEKEGVFMPDDRTAILFSDEAMLAAAVSAAEGKSVYKPDAAAKALFAGKPMLAGYFPESFVKSMVPAASPDKKASQVKSVLLTLNDKAGNIALHVDTRFDSASAATEIQAQANMVMGFLGMGLAQDKPGETEEQKRDRAFAVSALQSLKFAASGDTFSTDFSYPTPALVEKLSEKKQDILAAVAAQAKAKSAGASAARRSTKTATPAQ